MNAVEKDVELLVEKELKSANEKFPSFASAHEGYAVIKEEIEEASEELDNCKDAFEDMWKEIKGNNTKEQTICAKVLYCQAKNLACEAIQVAAMAQKLIDSLEEK